MAPEGFLGNQAGGILGGISTGQDVVVAIAVKPTSSIRLDRHSIDKAGQPVIVNTHGRHDPCVGIRATPIAEAMLACVLMDHALRHRAQNADVAVDTPRLAAQAPPDVGQRLRRRERSRRPRPRRSLEAGLVASCAYQSGASRRRAAWSVLTVAAALPLANVSATSCPARSCRASLTIAPSLRGDDRVAALEHRDGIQQRERGAQPLHDASTPGRGDRRRARSSARASCSDPARLRQRRAQLAREPRARRSEPTGVDRLPMVKRARQARAERAHPRRPAARGGPRDERAGAPRHRAAVRGSTRDARRRA